MNRRDLLASVGALLTTKPLQTDAVTATVLETSPAVAVVVLSAPGAIREDTAQRIKEFWNQVSPWPDARCVVLGDGMTLDVYDATGKRINATPVKRQRKRR